jgi:long-chain acyl-CoA synthetase
VVWLRDESGGTVELSSPDRTGELCIRGPGMFDAYLDPWLPSARVLGEDGFRTGDQGWFDADGDLHLAGRRASRINMAGMKFFAEEVEAVIDRHPAIQASRVRALDHAHLGEIPIAEIVLEPGSSEPDKKELARFCAEQLPRYKVPRQWSVVDALPTTPTGKVTRRPDRDPTAS